MSLPLSERSSSHLSVGSHERDILLTLFDLGRQVASVIDLDELLQKIPELIGISTNFSRRSRNSSGA